MSKHDLFCIAVILALVVVLCYLLSLCALRCKAEAMCQMAGFDGVVVNVDTTCHCFRYTYTSLDDVLLEYEVIP